MARGPEGPARPTGLGPLATLLAAAACCPTATAFVADPGVHPPRGLPGALKRWGASVPVRGTAAAVPGAQASGPAAAPWWWGLPPPPPWRRRAVELASVRQLALVLGVACTALGVHLGQGRLLGVGPTALFKVSAARPAAKLAVFDVSLLRWAKRQPKPAQQSAASAARPGLDGLPPRAAGAQAEPPRPCGPCGPRRPAGAGAPEAPPLQDAFRVSLLRAALGLLRQRNLEAAQATAVAAAAAAAAPPPPAGGQGA